MTTNELLILVVIGVVAAAFILRPLLRGRGASAARAPRPGPRAAAVLRPAASEELAELELDRAMGRVSEADFERWRHELEPVPDARQAEPVDDRDRAEALVRRWREAPRAKCPKCGERPEAGARFCSNCGASLDA